MGRRLIEVDISTLKASIEEAEENGPLSTQNDVWKKTAEIYNSTPGIPESITFSVVFLRAKQNNIEIKTKSARGRKPKSTQDVVTREVTTVVETSSPGTNVSELYVSVPERFHVLIGKIDKGSKVAAIKLNCLHCCGFVPVEVRGCTSKVCPLHKFRPYQKAQNNSLPRKPLKNWKEHEKPINFTRIC